MGRIITGNLDGVIQYVRSQAGSAELSRGQLAFLLRLTVHIILVMRELEIPHDLDAANEIIKEYGHVLMHYHVVRTLHEQANSRTITLLFTHITYLDRKALKFMPRS